MAEDFKDSRSLVRRNLERKRHWDSEEELEDEDEEDKGFRMERFDLVSRIKETDQFNEVVNAVSKRVMESLQGSQKRDNGNLGAKSKINKVKVDPSIFMTPSPSRSQKHSERLVASSKISFSVPSSFYFLHVSSRASKCPMLLSIEPLVSCGM